MTAADLASLAGEVSPGSAAVGTMLEQFGVDAPSAHAAVIVDVHGLPLAWSGSLPEETVDHFAAILMGLHALGSAAATCFVADRCTRQYIELDSEVLLLERIGDRALLGVVCDRRGDIGAVSYEATLLAARLETRLDAGVVAELAGRVGRT